LNRTMKIFNKSLPMHSSASVFELRNGNQHVRCAASTRACCN